MTWTPRLLLETRLLTETRFVSKHCQLAILNFLCVFQIRNTTNTFTFHFVETVRLLALLGCIGDRASIWDQTCGKFYGIWIEFKRTRTLWKRFLMVCQPKNRNLFVSIFLQQITFVAGQNFWSVMLALTHIGYKLVAVCLNIEGGLSKIITETISFLRKWYHTHNIDTLTELQWHTVNSIACSKLSM